MKALIVGGSGFLGVALAQRLLQKGATVAVYDLARSPELPPAAEFIAGDIRDRDKLRSAAAGRDTVFNLVGIMPQARASDEVMRAVNVTGAENALIAAAEAGARRLVFVSSSEIYGAPRTSPIGEDHPQTPIGEYGRNKVEAEALCQDYRRRTGLQVVILRPSTIVGPGITEPTFVKGMKYSGWMPLCCVGPGDNRFQMVELGDTAEACLLAAEKDGVDGEAFNLGAEGTLPFKRQLEELAKYLGRQPRVFCVPAGPFKAVMRLLTRLRLCPMEPDHYELADADYVMDVRKAARMLGWRPTKTNLEMIHETYDWHRNHA